MGNISVRFLKRNYLISDQLPKYISVLEEYEAYTNRLLQMVVQQAKKGEYTGGADEDFVFWKIPIENIAKEIIKNAANEGVYDLTTVDLVQNNPGYKKLHKVCEDTMQGMVNALMNAMTDWLDGVERSEREAASHITGSGVSIWTSSLSSALIYSAIESSTIKRQCNQADKEYRAAIGELSARTDSKQKQDENRVLTTVYYPGCNEAIPLIISYMLNIFLERIEQSGTFDYSDVKKYDMSSSVEIMKNLQLVSQKEEVIHKAFEKCPYNPDVYKAVLDYVSVDYDTFSIAKMLKQEKILLPFIKSYCEDVVLKQKNDSEIVKIWAYYENVDVLQIYQKIYKNTLDDAMSGLHSAIKAIAEYNSCVAWIKIWITDSVDEIKAKENDLDKLVGSVLQKYIDKDTFDKLNNLGVIPIEEINLTGNTSANYDMLMEDLRTKLVGQIKQVISKQDERQEVIASEIKILKETISQKEREFNSIKEKLTAEVEKLRNERNSCGIFAFSKKKELDSNLASVEQNLNEKEKEYEKDVKKLYNSCQEKEKQMTCIS